ncbi:hypothetical protein ZHAS_00014998 [Anopheles sinensis]|uniref:Uncharacterized protein n=1 Tax=Anopheles sinensis TaxID=74873 RepID=A0A084W9S8_ANOSI|nr:hypothetical protein ZHAS_00014998 [Anopheles sinensis]
MRAVAVSTRWAPPDFDHHLLGWVGSRVGVGRRKLSSSELRADAYNNFLAAFPGAATLTHERDPKPEEPPTFGARGAASETR